jgi:branched-chain amino acid transport system ATP-binding protein
VSGSADLVLDGVVAGYGEMVVLEGVSLRLSPGETLALLGRNGVGKSTLLATIMGLTRLHRGSLKLGELALERLSTHRRARVGLGYVPQEREIFPSLSVEENLVVADRRGAWTLSRVYDLFPSLAARRRNGGTQLSGGEQQMLSIGRALMGDPKLLLMDEPLEGLAPVVVDTLLAAIERLKREAGLAIVLVEQNARRTLGVASTAVVLDRGRVVYSGTSGALAADPQRLNHLMGVTGKS